MTDILEVRELHEHAEEARHEKDAFVSRVSILVAVLAVVTAATSSLENTETAGAITDSSRAVLAQDKATDQWNFYESKSLKKNLFDVAAGQGGAKAADYAKKSATKRRTRRPRRTRRRPSSTSATRPSNPASGTSIATTAWPSPPPFWRWESPSPPSLSSPANTGPGPCRPSWAWRA